MPKGQPGSTKVLLNELGIALKEVDGLKVELRKAKSRVTALMQKLDIRIGSSRLRRRGKRA